jgi:hypothetical protein
MVPKYEGKELHPGCEQGWPRVPKKEVAINPINPRGELARSLCPRAKIEHCGFNIRPFEAAFSGIDRA